MSGDELVPPEKSRPGASPPPNEAQVDHVTPKSKGGTVLATRKYCQGGRTVQRATTKTPNQSAAIVCAHVARNGYPVLRAQRDVPVDSDDSGWQFLCDSGEEESEGEAQVWAVSEVLQHEPTLTGLLEQAPGTALHREGPTRSWRVLRR